VAPVVAVALLLAQAERQLRDKAATAEPGQTEDQASFPAAAAAALMVPDHRQQATRAALVVLD
jgi:hypothetical protein